MSPPPSSPNQSYQGSSGYNFRPTDARCLPRSVHLPPTRHTPLEPLPVAYNLLDFLTQTSFPSPLWLPTSLPRDFENQGLLPSILGTDSLRIVFALCPSQGERVLFPGFGS